MYHVLLYDNYNEQTSLVPCNTQTEVTKLLNKLDPKYSLVNVEFVEIEIKRAEEFYTKDENLVT